MKIMHVFDFQNQQVSKKKKKKKAESLLGAPFHLKDGDTIGVKVLTEYILKMCVLWLCWSSYCLSNFPQNLLIDNNRVFSTPDEEEGQRKLKEQSEQQRKG